MRRFYHIALILLPLCIQAQQKFLLSTDQPFYFSGEEVRVSVVANSSTEKSALTIILEDDSQRKTKKYVTPLEGIFSTSFSLDQGSKGVFSLSVYMGSVFMGGHSFQVLDREEKDLRHQPLAKSDQFKSRQLINITGDTALVTNRENTLELSVDELSNVRLSVSVSNRFSENDFNSTELTKPTDPTDKPRNILLKGQLKDLEQRPLSNHFFLIVVPSYLSINQFLGITDENGYFEVDVLHNEPNLNCVFLSKDRKIHHQLVVDLQSNELESVQVNPFNSLEVDVSRMQENLIINHAFNPLDSVITQSGEIVSIYDEFAHHKIKLSDFTQLASMSEVFKEIVPMVYQSYQNKGRIVVDPEPPFTKFLQPPLFAINGIPLFDQSFIKELDPAQVEEIGVVNKVPDLQRFSNLGAGGMILFRMKESYDISQVPKGSNIVSVQGVEERIEPFVFSEDDVSMKSLLYWNPYITVSSENGFTMKFDTSHESGEYWVYVNGYANSGERISYSKKIKVSQEIVR